MSDDHPNGREHNTAITNSYHEDDGPQVETEEDPGYNDDGTPHRNYANPRETIDNSNDTPNDNIDIAVEDNHRSAWQRWRARRSRIMKAYEHGFAAYGRLLTCHWMFTLCVAVVPVLGVGLLALGLTQVELSSDPNALWTPEDTLITRERDQFNRIFGPFQRMELVIFHRYQLHSDHKQAGEEEDNDNANVLDKGALNTVFDYHELLNTVETEDGVRLEDICLRPGGRASEPCIINDVRYYWATREDMLNDTDIGRTLASTATYPYGGFINNRLITSSPVYNDNRNRILSVRAFLSTVLVRNDDNVRDAAVRWEGVLVDRLQSFQKELHTSSSLLSSRTRRAEASLTASPDSGVQVEFQTESSLERELGKYIAADIPLIGLSYGVMFLYVVFALSRLPPVGSRVLLVLWGLLQVGAGVAGVLGLAAWAGVAFSPITTQVLPFLILGISVDNIFIMTSFLHDQDPAAPSRIRITRTLSQAGPSIIITTASDFVAFLVGTSTQMPAVRDFCLQAAAAVVVNFGLQFTSFICVMSLDDRRWQSRRWDVLVCIPSKHLPVFSSRSSSEHGIDTDQEGEPRGWGSPTQGVPDEDKEIEMKAATTPPNGSQDGMREASLRPLEGGRGEGSGAGWIPQGVDIPRPASPLSLHRNEDNDHNDKHHDDNNNDNNNNNNNTDGDGDDYHDGVPSPGRTNIEGVPGSNHGEGEGERDPDLDDVTDGCSATKTGPGHSSSHPNNNGSSFPPQWWSSPVQHFLSGPYLRVLLHPGTAVVLSVVLMVGLGVSIWGCTQLRMGLGVQQVVPQDSYLQPFTDMRETLFPHLGPPVYIVIDDPTLDYSTRENQIAVQGFLNGAMQNPYLDSRSTLPWHQDFFTYVVLYSRDDAIFEREHNYVRPDRYMELMRQFLRSDMGKAYELDILLDASESNILATRMMTNYVQLNTTDDFVNGMQTLRDYALQFSSFNSFTYSNYYVFFEQYTFVTQEALINLSSTALAIMIVVFLFLLDFQTSFIVFISLVFMDVNLLAVMYVWNITLNSIAVFNLLMATGLAVDYSVHIARHFSTEPNDMHRSIKIKRAMKHVGSGVCNGAISTILAIAILGFARYEVFRIYYFRMFFTIVLLGVTYGLVFVPITLRWFGPGNFKDWLREPGSKEIK